MKALIVIVIIVLGALLMWFAVPAHSQAMSFCGPYTEFKEAVERGYGEKSLGKGISGGGQVVIELFVSKETFTILSIGTSGRACIIAAGRKWKDFPRQVDGDAL